MPSTQLPNSCQPAVEGRSATHQGRLAPRSRTNIGTRRRSAPPGGARHTPDTPPSCTPPTAPQPRCRTPRRPFERRIARSKCGAFETARRWTLSPSTTGTTTAPLDTASRIWKSSGTPPIVGGVEGFQQTAASRRRQFGCRSPSFRVDDPDAFNGLGIENWRQSVDRCTASPGSIWGISAANRVTH